MVRNGLFLTLAFTGLFRVGAADPAPRLPAAPPARYAMQVTGAKHVAGVWRIKVHTTDFPADEWALFFPVAVEHARQKEVKMTMEPEGELVKELSQAQRPVLSLRVRAKDGKTPQSVSVAVRYEATLLARRLAAVRPGDPAPVVPPMGARETALELASTPTLDFRAEPFESWLDTNKLRRGKAEGEIEFARRVYSAMTGLYGYKEGVAIRQASKACDLAELDCDTLSVVFAAAMRANDVPCRVVFGWPARTIKPDPNGIISGHAQAEFFAARVGWVPVDLAEGLVARRNKKDPMKYFGEESGNLLVAQVNPDYVVRNPVGRQFINSMHPGPSVWTRGAKKPDVHFKPQIWEVEVKTVPIPRGR